jgi:membrane-bound serine protease (ClpP class)
MTWVFVLLLLAAVLISFEIIIPGAVLGLLGLCAYLAACIYAGVHFGFLKGVFTFFAGGAFLGVLLYFEFKWIPHTWLGRQLFLAKQVEGKSNSGISEELVGKTGEAATPLRPTGLVLVDGTRYEAQSQDGYIDTGETVKVTSKDNFRIVVSKA